jgi:hypothetical protein
MSFDMIRKRDFFIKATLVCKENGESYNFDAMIIYLTIRKTIS